MTMVLITVVMMVTMMMMNVVMMMIMMNYSGHKERNGHSNHHDHSKLIISVITIMQVAIGREEQGEIVLQMKVITMMALFVSFKRETVSSFCY